MTRTRTFKGYRLLNVADPVATTDVVNLRYLQANNLTVTRSKLTTTFSVPTTAGNVTGLAVAVVSGKTYRIASYIANVATGTTNVNFGFTGPTVTGTKYTIDRGIDASVSSTVSFTALTDAAAGAAVVATWARVSGIIIPSANGTLQLRAIRANDGTSMVLQPGSFLLVEEI